MLALWRLDRDPVAGRVAPERRRELVADARAAGATLARRVRAGQRGPVEARLGLAGVRIVEDGGTEQAASLIHHAVYTSPPPTVTLYRRALSALERVVNTEGFRAGLWHPALTFDLDVRPTFRCGSVVALQPGHRNGGANDRENDR